MKTKLKKFGIPGLGLLAMMVISFSLPSCHDDDNEITPDQYVDNWIYEQMDFWYYWQNDLPSKPNKKLEPEPFFESLLSSQDRFSWIQENFVDLLNSLQGVSKEAGFEFVLYRESESSENVIGQILYVKPNSPAEDAGLKRGDVFKKINGQQITTSNYQGLLSAIDQPYSLTYQAIDINTESFSVEQTVNLSPIEYAEDPNFLHTVIETGEKKIGYYVYNFFAEGPTSGSKTYTQEMDNIFADFKSAGITDLVIDLRFNSGGAETATVNLASQIAPGVNSSTLFAKREYNNEVTNQILNDPQLGADFLNTYFTNKSQNIGSLITSGRIFILTGSRTASASELLINGLRPFLDVYLIGDVTVGKNVGSVSLYEDNDPKNTWGMQPIVVKIFNSLGESNYSEGFTPDMLDEDNSLFLFPLGDPDEPLLSKAIEVITGTSSMGRKGARLARQKHADLVGSSIDAKRRGLVIQLPDMEIESN